jgi:hypothetical protein
LTWDESKGYSRAFAARHDEILRSIIGNPDTVVTLVAGFDDICNCGVCPRKGEHCQSPQLLEKDRRVAGKFGLVIGGVYRSKELVVQLAKRESARHD